MFQHLDNLLRARGDVAAARVTPGTLGWFLTLLLVCGICYGMTMGAYTPERAPRPQQMLYSGLKVPLLLLATFAISLPNYFVLYTLFGLRDDFSRALRALLATQAGLTVILASFAPFTALWYCSSTDYRSSILFNGLMFAIAALASQLMLRRYYRPLIARNANHRILLRCWLIIYGFVGIQMGWILRPFIGQPDQPTTFFREEIWGNAYVILYKMITSLLNSI